MIRQIGEDIQIVLQTLLGSGSYQCEGFTGIPVINPCLIAITTNGEPATQSWAGILRQELWQAILSLSSSAAATGVPCPGRIESPLRCHAKDVAACQKLLVMVGDSSIPFPASQEVDTWSSSTPNYHVLPVFPAGAAANQLLPASLQHLNAAFWQHSIAELVPKIFSIVGLTAQDYRIFISYRRQDALALSEQLFTALAQENFDVFLDRFRMDPGVDFKIRIEQELADKAMVLVIESPDLINSPWCLHEINYAKRNRLGLLALNLHNSWHAPGINRRARLALSAPDFLDPNHPEKLAPPALDRVIQRVKTEHGQALVRRRSFVRRAMQAALRLNGMPGPKLSPDGLIRVQAAGSGRRYAIWLSARAPDLPDFQLADTSRTPGEIGLILGPAISEASRRARIDWLAQKSGIRCFDEGRIFSVAGMIAGGVL